MDHNRDEEFDDEFEFEQLGSDWRLPEDWSGEDDPLPEIPEFRNLHLQVDGEKEKCMEHAERQNLGKFTGGSVTVRIEKMKGRDGKRGGVGESKVGKVGEKQLFVKNDHSKLNPFRETPKLMTCEKNFPVNYLRQIQEVPFVNNSGIYRSPTFPVFYGANNQSSFVNKNLQNYGMGNSRMNQLNTYSQQYPFSTVVQKNNFHFVSPKIRTQVQNKLMRPDGGFLKSRPSEDLKYNSNQKVTTRGIQRPKQFPVMIKVKIPKKRRDYFPYAMTFTHLHSTNVKERYRYDLVVPKERSDKIIPTKDAARCGLFQSFVIPGRMKDVFWGKGFPSHVSASPNTYRCCFVYPKKCQQVKAVGVIALSWNSQKQFGEFGTSLPFDFFNRVDVKTSRACRVFKDLRVLRFNFSFKCPHTGVKLQFFDKSTNLILLETRIFVVSHGKTKSELFHWNALFDDPKKRKKKGKETEKSKGKSHLGLGQDLPDNFDDGLFW